MIVAKHSITAEKLLAMGDIGRCELIDGEIIQMAPAGAEHGFVGNQIAYLLTAHVRQYGLGRIYTAETGFMIARNPDTVRAPDVAFVRTDRLSGHPRRGYFQGPPDLAVEIISPNDTAAEIEAKTQHWIEVGTVSVWIVDPLRRCIEVHRNQESPHRYCMSEVLANEPTLPGLKVAIADVFQD